jgi:phospholipid/cholesterol/gamma-HCH transport system substrate-binding protein
MSREAKIAIFAIVTVSLAVWGAKFLGGINILSSTTDLYVEYDDVADLAPSAPVVLRGLRVGTVQDIYQKEDDLNKMIVILTLDKGIRIPKTAISEIYAPSMTGGKQVRLVFDGSCKDGDCAKSGDYIKGRVIGMLGSLIPQSDINQYMDLMSGRALGLFDTLKTASQDPNSGLVKTMQDLQATAANLKKLTGRIDGIMASSQSDIAATTRYLESVMENLKSSNSRITHILANVDTLSGNLADIQLDKTVGSVNDAVSQLRTTLASTNTAIAEVGGLLNNLKSGQGTLGMLMTSDSLYRNLNDLTDHIGWLTQDLRLNPKRYTSIFKKRVTPYIYPGGDPALLFRDSLK